jgi:hypothetical protein
MAAFQCGDKGLSPNSATPASGAARIGGPRDRRELEFELGRLRQFVEDIARRSSHGGFNDALFLLLEGFRQRRHSVGCRLDRSRSNGTAGDRR